MHRQRTLPYNYPVYATRVHPYYVGRPLWSSEYEVCRTDADCGGTSDRTRCMESIPSFKVCSNAVQAPF